MQLPAVGENVRPFHNILNSCRNNNCVRKSADCSWISWSFGLFIFSFFWSFFSPPRRRVCVILVWKSSIAYGDENIIMVSIYPYRIVVGLGMYYWFFRPPIFCFLLIFLFLSPFVQLISWWEAGSRTLLIYQWSHTLLMMGEHTAQTRIIGLRARRRRRRGTKEKSTPEKKT